MWYSRMYKDLTIVLLTLMSSIDEFLMCIISQIIGPYLSAYES